MRTMLAILFGAALTSSVTAATFTVNSNNDVNDGTCDVAHCSFREAINAANAAPGADVIAFSIGSGAQEIAIAIPSAVLTVTDSVTIDGTTQPGFSSAPLITLRGDNQVFGGLLLDGGSQSSTVRSLAIYDFGRTGISVDGTVGSITIEGNDVSVLPVTSTSSRGIVIDADLSGLVIRGNVVHSCGENGILVARADGGSGVIENNILGLRPDGLTPDGNNRGMQIGASVGPLMIRNNVIASNRSDGMLVSSSGHTIENNLIGIAANGSTPRPNARSGISVALAANVTIRNNTISNNGVFAIFMAGSGSAVVRTNTITSNDGGGIFIRSFGESIIGGTAAEGNLIAFNGGPGVQIDWEITAPSSGTRIEGNSIHSNDGLGIDLTPANGVTPNDAGDVDTDIGNRGQNFPVITSAVSSGSAITVNGTLNSEALVSYRICVYGNSAGDLSSHGEGEFALGCTLVNTDAAGNAVFSLATTAPPTMLAVAATATPLTGPSINSTSEFSGSMGATTPGVLQFSAASYAVAEGGNAAIVVQRTGGSGGTVTASFATSNGSAVSGSDYVGTNVTVAFTDGDTAPKAVLVPIVVDGTNEASETFTVSLSNPTGGASIGSQSMAVVTISDDDPLPQLSINDVAVTEGNSGGVSATFTVSLAGSTAQQVTVNYATANVTATAPADYTPASGTLTFAPGTTTQTIVVTVNGDLSIESNETFQVNLSSPVNATISDGQGTGTIADDDTPPSLSIGDITVAESGAAVFSVSLSNASGTTVTVNYATANATALAGQDYVSATGQLTFGQGDTTKSVSVALIDDATTEGTETFVVNLSAPVNATIADNQAQASVTDNDAIPAISINDASMVEGSGTLGFTVTLSNPSSSIVTAQWSTANGTATSGSDYVASAQSLTIPAGQTSATVSVVLTGDAVVEGNEDFFVNLSAPVSATIADGQGRGTIIDDDGTPAFTISDSSAVEGSGQMSFTVTLSPPSSQMVTVDYQTVDGTAGQPFDYTPTSGTLTFPPGLTSWTFLMVIPNDSLVELTEAFTVELSNPVNATIARAQATGTIADDDAKPSLTISDATMTEGGLMQVTVTLSSSPAEAAAVNLQTVPGSASGGVDYVSQNTTLWFNPGTMEQTVIISLLDDTLVEGTETFTIELSAPINATISRGQATGTIIDDDVAPGPLPTLTVSDTSASESSGAMSFTVTLAPASAQTVTVNHQTANGTAVAGSDFTATTGTLTFSPGQTSQAIAVPIGNDAFVESTETFVVDLSAPSNATTARSQATGTIIDDDIAPGPLPTLTISDTSASESSGTMSFTVTLAPPSAQPVTVNYQTANGTASAGADYTATSGTLSVIPGQTSLVISVPVANDALVESTETFVVNLTAPVNVTIARAQATGTIIDDDQAGPATPSLSINDIVVAEGNGGTVNAIFTVTLSAVSSSPVSVKYATANGTAVGGSDYVVTVGTLTFGAGMTSQMIPVPVMGDNFVEATETFSVTLSAPANATLGDSSGAGTIVNDDFSAPAPPPPPPPAPPAPPAPALTIDPAIRVTECTAGSGVDAMFNVYASDVSASPISIKFHTVDGTAVAGSDYTGRSGVLTIPAFSASASFTVRVLCDALDEPDETFFMALSEPVNGSLRTAMAAVTIADDDVAEPQRRAFAAVVGSTPGAAGSQFHTSVRVFNPSEQPIEGMLIYHPAGRSGADTDPSIHFALQPGESRFYPDILVALGTTGVGTLDVIALEGELPLTFIRVFNDGGSKGTTGFIEEELSASAALRSGERGVLFVPFDLDAFRFNAGVRTLEEGAELEIEVKSESGQVRFRSTRSLLPNYFVQTTGDDFAGTKLQAGDTLVIAVRAGALFAYGATTDNVTNDPSVQFVRKLR